MTNLEVGEIVMCTVDKIVGTFVFVKIDGNGQGSITLSEIAPGRIRNLREYVVPKKRIVCKILKISGDRIELSLRRVTPKEQKELREQENLEKAYVSVLKTILKEKAEEIIEKIKEKEKLYEFLEEAKIDAKSLEKIVGKEKAEKILNILKTQKQKEFFLKKEFFLTSQKPEGIKLIKEILGKIEDAEIKYISAGRYMIRTSSDNLKKADKKLSESLEFIEKSAKKNNAEFKIK